MRYRIVRREKAHGQHYGPNTVARFEEQGDANLFIKATIDHADQHGLAIDLALYEGRTFRYDSNSRAWREALVKFNAGRKHGPVAS